MLKGSCLNRQYLGGILLTALLALGGCYTGQENQLAKCQATISARMSALGIGNKSFGLQVSADFIEMCMLAHGYIMQREECSEFSKTLAASADPENIYRRATSPRCYVPRNWRGRQLLKLKRWLGRVPERP